MLIKDDTACRQSTLLFMELTKPPRTVAFIFLACLLLAPLSAGAEQRALWRASAYLPESKDFTSPDAACQYVCAFKGHQCGKVSWAPSYGYFICPYPHSSGGWFGVRAVSKACEYGKTWNNEQQMCEPSPLPESGDPNCDGAGNPISILNGNKYQSLSLYEDAGLLSVSFFYNSHPGA